MKRLLAALAVPAAVLLVAPAAGAAGVGGVELTPPSGSSFTVTARAGQTVTQDFTLRNVGTAPATVRLYAADASQVDGGWSVGAAGSAPWLHLPDQTVTLAAGEHKAMSVRVDGGAHTGAIVVEQAQGTVVQRAATLVRLTPPPVVPVPLLLAAAAAGLVLAAGAGVGAAARRRVVAAAA